MERLPAGFSVFSHGGPLWVVVLASEPTACGKNMNIDYKLGLIIFSSVPGQARTVLRAGLPKK